MAFFSLLLVMPLLLLCALATFLLPALNAVAAVLLAVHLLILGLLLALYVRLRRAGRLGRAYAAQFSDWRRWGVRAAGWALILGGVWEGLMALLCLAWLFLRPLRIFF